ncbi:hypothetical protein LGL08_20225 [Clostridium estertheticum]|uniref:hypothetical protein n=1 Tax=Clostridium estertheticum TaxID=238834 RepID=UPI001CF46076|nr:hypothetical protein [Clostridium estertheticum]MCB2309033.1 hypothetical protein [Clostridium estertheticum]MCB2346833.1 hypothetical protein [Clostridium estertheticum]MCB2351855.1 hypothetical protein [Clostridium estertheticum]WAG48383.1 hypothetical protein LL127_23030 [Clostridium estertheticum]
MKLTNRDIEIINFIEKNLGATINQIQNLFFPSYDVTANRLKILSDNKFIKVQVHPILGKKVYYLKKVPSFHSLVINDVVILLKDKLNFMQREYKIKNNHVDCIFIMKEGKILILEVDIFNRTKDKKIDEVINALEETKVKFEFWIITKHQVMEKKKKEKIKYIMVTEIEKKIKQYLI